MNWKKLSRWMLMFAVTLTVAIAGGASIAHAGITSESSFLDLGTPVICEKGQVRYNVNGAACNHSKSKWSFDGFEWGEGEDGTVRAYGLYHCTKCFNAKAELQATVEPVSEGSYKATIYKEDSLDAKNKDYTSQNNLEYHTLIRIFDHFVWVKDSSSDIGVKAYAQYRDPYNRNHTGWNMYVFDAKVSLTGITYKAWTYFVPDGTIYTEMTQTSLDANNPSHHHNWIYRGIEWDLKNYNIHTNTGAVAYAKWYCANGCGEHTEGSNYLLEPLQVNCTREVKVYDSSYIVTFEASIDAASSKDGWDHYDSNERYMFWHEWVLDPYSEKNIFEWYVEDGKWHARGTFHCKYNPSETYVVEAEVQQVTSDNPRVFIPKYEATIRLVSSEYYTYTDTKTGLPITPKPIDPGHIFTDPIKKEINPIIDDLIGLQPGDKP